MGETAAFDEAQWDRDIAEFRRVCKQIRRLVTIGIKNGLPWYAATTVEEVAKASKKPPEEVVRLIEECGYLFGVVRDSGPMASWVVFEDGE